MDIRDVLQELNIPFRGHGESSLVSEGWVGLICPFPGCGQGGKFGCGIHIRSRRVSCWKCGKRRLADTLALASGQGVPAVLKLTGQIEQDYSRPEARSTGIYKPPTGIGELLPVHQKYLTRRGFDPDALVERYGIGGIGIHATHPWRLFIPIQQHGKPVSWTTRAIGNIQPRYLSASPADESIPLKHTLFGWDQVHHSICVVEGPFDAMRIGPGGAGTYGLTVTRQQVALIATVPNRLICFDNSPDAQRRAQELAAQLAVFPGSTSVVCLEQGNDPGDAPESEIQEIREMLK